MPPRPMIQPRKPMKTERNNRLRGWGAILALTLAGGIGLAADDPELGAAASPPPAAGQPAAAGAADFAYLDRLLAREMADATLSAAELGRLRALRERLKSSLTAQTQPAPAKSLRQEADLLSESLKSTLQKLLSDRRSEQTQRDLALFYLFRDEPDKALTYLAAPPTGEPDVFQPWLAGYAFVKLGDHSRAAECLERITRRLTDKLPLSLSEPVLCTEVTAYRLYTPRPAEPVNAGEDLLLYLEIAGATFRIDETGAGCALDFGLTLKDSLQETVWEEASYGSWEKTYRGPVHDLHVMINLRVPNHLATGRYHLLVKCTDRATGRNGSSGHAFDVKGTAAAPKLGTPQSLGAWPNNNPLPTDATELEKRLHLEALKMQHQLNPGWEKAK